MRTTCWRKPEKLPLTAQCLARPSALLLSHQGSAIAISMTPGTACVRRVFVLLTSIGMWLPFHCSVWFHFACAQRRCTGGVTVRGNKSLSFLSGSLEDSEPDEKAHTRVSIPAEAVTLQTRSCLSLWTSPGISACPSLSILNG